MPKWMKEWAGVWMRRWAICESGDATIAILLLLAFLILLATRRLVVQ